MLTAKAHSVSFRLKERGSVALPARALMLHDEGGTEWPKRSLIFPDQYELTAVPLEMDQAGKGWLGRGYKAHKGLLRLPPTALDHWELIGEASQIHYVRRGVFAPGLFKHDFKRERFIFPDHGPTQLYRGPGGFHRLDLPPTGLINWRGFVEP